VADVPARAYARAWMDQLSSARTFVYSEGRVLEQRLFAAVFEGAPAAGVVRALEAYRNDDGGLGHGLEPDKRCPDSQPLDLQFGFEALDLAGADARPLAAAAAGFLDAVADERGAVPFLLPSARDYPHAEHLGLDVFYLPHAWPTSSLAGWLHAFGVSHPWLDRATAFCFAELEREQPGDAHAIREALRFLRHAPDRERADALRPRVVARLDGASYLVADPADEEYGVTPLEFEAGLFAPAQVEGHLDRLAAEQQADGGWPLRWEPPSTASLLEWRGMRTVMAVHTLRLHGRL
jgi:hypothetical protein